MGSCFLVSIIFILGMVQFLLNNYLCYITLTSNSHTSWKIVLGSDLCYNIIYLLWDVPVYHLLSPFYLCLYSPGNLHHYGMIQPTQGLPSDLKFMLIWFITLWIIAIPTQICYVFFLFWTGIPICISRHTGTSMHHFLT